MRRTCSAFAVLAALAISPAARAEAPPAQGHVVYAAIPAHPALWTVHKSKGTVYLFGSIHILPPQIDWHTPEIDAAIAKADSFVFEVSMDAAALKDVQTFVRERGMLPPGQNLRDMLSPEAKRNYDARIARLSVPPERIGRMRPWLAGLTIGVLDVSRQNYSAQSGVDLQLQASARKNGKPIIGLETPEQQLELLAPDDPKTELQTFEAGLAGADKPSASQVGPLIDAWIHGNAARIGTIMNRAFDKFPRARVTLVDNRNRAWAARIAELLEEPKTYFVTVGAAHLAGSTGVPNLLRRKGYSVSGP